MGSRCSRQGSAALSHVRRATRQAIALVAALVVVLLAAPTAMAGTARVDGTTLFFQAVAPAEVNNVTVTQSGDSYRLSDETASISPGNGCSADGGAVVCTADPPIGLIYVNVGDGDDAVVVNAFTPAEIYGRAGDDTLTGGNGADVVDGFTGNDTINVQDGVRDKRVRCGEGSDSVTSDRADVVPPEECEINDDGFFPTTTILAGPLGPPGNTAPSFNFEADESPVQFNCAIAPVETPPDQVTWSSCAPNQGFAAPTEGEWVFRVYAQDDIGAGGVAEVTFIVDMNPPTLTISGPASPVATSTPTFEFSANEPNVRTECSLDGSAFSSCGSPYTAGPLPDGDHVFEVRGTDLGRNEMVATFPFRVSVPGDNGVPPNTPVAPRRIIIDSLVLISGAGVKMSRRGIVGIRLACAGSRTCKGRMRITTAEPVKRRSKKLVTLGSKRFTIGANKKRKINVRFSKSKRRLARRLKRFKAKVVINEVDQRGNPRISSRIFILRAR